MTSADTIRIVFLGTPAFSLAALQALHDAPNIEIACVVSQPDRPSGRGQKLMPPPIRVLAEQLNLPVVQTASIKKDTELKDRLRTLAPDFLVTVAFGQILTQEVLDIPKLATVNAHASLLPEYRGANPIQQAILDGQTVTGITTMLTELGVDTGPMLLKAEVPIGPEDTLGEVAERLSVAAGPLLVETLTGFAAGTVKPETQDDTKATHAPKVDKSIALLDWQQPAAILQRQIRAFNPAPGAAAFFDGERVKLLRARLAPNPDSLNLNSSLKSGRPGDILAMIDSGILIQTGGGILEVTSLQPAGKKEMPARSWATGALKNGTGHFEPAQTAASNV